jgi:uncharacterized protein (DUF305 family)
MAKHRKIAGRNAHVKAFAQKIPAAQAAEIGTMKAWLTAWRDPPAGHDGTRHYRNARHDV